MKIITSLLRRYQINKCKSMNRSPPSRITIIPPPSSAATGQSGSLTPTTNPIKTTAKVTIISILFGKYLLITNTISCGILMFAGDIISQEIEFQQKKKIIIETKQQQQPVAIATVEGRNINYIRAGSMFLVGTLQGPIQHYFYSWMDRKIIVIDFINVMKKILLDQIIMSPICILAFFYPAGLLDGQSLKTCNKEVSQKFFQVYKMDWTVWPLVQFINFYFIPGIYRVIYINFITMLYNVYLCYVKNDDSTVE